MFVQVVLVLVGGGDGLRVFLDLVEVGTLMPDGF